MKRIEDLSTRLTRRWFWGPLSVCTIVWMGIWFGDVSVALSQKFGGTVAAWFMVAIMFATGVAMVVAGVAWSMPTTAPQRRCLHCRYDLSASPLDSRCCPECGQKIVRERHALDERAAANWQPGPPIAWQQPEGVLALLPGILLSIIGAALAFFAMFMVDIVRQIAMGP